MPAWWARYLEARQLGMTLPALEAWCWHGSGSYYLPRLRVGWQIEAVAARQAMERARTEATERRWRQGGWQGGAADPADSCVFVEDVAA